MFMHELWFKKKNIVTVILVFFVLMAVTACSPPAAQEVVEEQEELSAVEAEQVVLKLEGPNAGYPTPFAHYPRMRGTVMKYVFDSLLEIDEQGYILWLAEDWQISEDGTEHLITLRPGVKWHDGTDLTVDDVVFSFNYYQQFPAVFIGETIMDKDILTAIEAVSDTQVRFVTAEPSGTFYEEAGVMRIIPRHIWEEVDDPYNYTEPEAYIGCGPFILTDYSQEHNTYRYEAFLDYWGPKQRASVLEFVPVSDAILALENGDIDIARIAPDLVERFESNADFRVVESPAFAGYLLSLNMNENELFKDVLFRQALTYAIDRNELIQKVARGAAKPGSPGGLPLDHQWYNPAIRQYDYDLEKAADLLQEAGVSGPLQFELLVGEGPEVRLGEVLKEQLAKVGIELTVVSLDTKTRDSRANEGQYELAVLAMGSWGLDADWLRIRYASTGSVAAGGGSATALLGAGQGYSNPALDLLFEAQRVEADRNQRRAIFFEIQEILAEEVPEIPLYNVLYYYAFQPEHYDGWTFMFDHPVMEHAKLSFLER
jgi:peptide/nickel transport system substrate-binding protein